jgi:SAM-dependent methyltransferase
MSGYQRQDRGGGSAYDRYLQGMDASMRQKVALTAAHLLCEGELADMGMGSGTGSHALASLYPDLKVIGVDIDPEMVARASERYAQPNLRFVQGDIAEQCFAPGSLEAILDSSVIHHVTSYSGYERARAAQALEVQARQLADGGVLVVRDFVDPGPGMVWLDVPSDDGEGDEPEHCSSARLLERLARQFRRLAPEPERGFALRRIDAATGPVLRDGWRRYELSHSHAVEFVLRKDYRQSWDVEVQEEYCWATQAEMEALCERLGLRVLASTPIRNPWIVRNRFEDRFCLWSSDGEPLDWPATNIVVVGQKVAPGQGVRISECTAVPRTGYVELTGYRRVATGKVLDLARRPGIVVDVIPWFERHGSIQVLARRGYPRPILASNPRGSVPLDGATSVTYVTEPLIAEQRDKPLGQTVEEMLVGLEGLDPDRIRHFDPGPEYYPSPGGVQEQARSMFVQVEPLNVHLPLDNASGFGSSGVLRAIESRQLLRAAQVGGLPDARLELNVYELLLRQGRNAGAWIGEAIDLQPGPRVEAHSCEDVATRPRRRAFRPAAELSGFLEVRAAELEEVDASGNHVAREVRELVLPVRHSLNTVAVAVLRRDADAIYLGVEDDDLPASQCFDGHSELLVAPAWRVPEDVIGMRAARQFLRERLASEHGLTVGRIWELGGRYHPSAGITPEVVYPLAVQVDAVASPDRALLWLRLDELIGRRDLLLDGHLRIVALRAAHALGVLPV